MNKNVTVLGSGLVGRAIAIDLARSGLNVKVIDQDAEKKIAVPTIGFVSADIRDMKILGEAIHDADIVIGALPGSLGFEMMRKIIESGKNLVDISFCPEDYMELDELAREKGVTVIPDMGIAPGLCNVLCGFHDKRMQIDSYKCLVGGLPKERNWPLEYKAAWSPADVIEEYVRPARFRQHGKDVVKPALSDNEISYFQGIGSLEEWNSDGLRSLLKTMPHIPNMVEKTLRYPGTVEYLRVLRELGFFSSDPVRVDDLEVRPVDVTARLLFPLWQLNKGEKEFTVMKVIIEGKENGKPKKYSYYIYDEYDRRHDTSSMARTTGFSCTAAAHLLLEGRFTSKGVCPPEFLGTDPAHVEYILEHLKGRNIFIEKNEEGES